MPSTSNSLPLSCFHHQFLESNRLIQGHLPAKDQQYLNVTAYVHERSHPALDETGFINKDDLGVYLGSTNGPDRCANTDDYPM